MAKYVTRTIESYNTNVTFVMNNQINNYVLMGIVGIKEAKKQIKEIFETKDVIIVSCEKVLESSKMYRMLETEFIKHSEIVDNNSDTSTEV